VTAEVARLAPAAASGRVRMAFVYLRGSAGIYYLFGKESGADDLIAALGGVDVAGSWDGAACSRSPTRRWSPPTPTSSW
jgi:ABC-type hemin transport system substrate-binding protein